MLLVVVRKRRARQSPLSLPLSKHLKAAFKQDGSGRARSLAEGAAAANNISPPPSSSAVPPCYLSWWFPHLYGRPSARHVKITRSIRKRRRTVCSRIRRAGRNPLFNARKDVNGRRPPSSFSADHAVEAILHSEWVEILLSLHSRCSI